MQVRPFDLHGLARVLDRDVERMQRRLDRLRHAAAAVALHPADPGLDHDVPARQRGVLRSLHLSARALSTVAGEMASAAADALVADGAGGTAGDWSGLATNGGRAPICRLPGDLRSTVDRRLTDTVGDGLSVLATVALRVAARAVPPADGNVSGDPGGTFSSRRVPFAGLTLGHDDTAPPSPASRLVVAALDATADQTVLAHDEFGLVDLGHDRYTVVLPGVTDLSRPEPGWSPAHRSVRDLDMAAIPSSRSARVDDNRYAATVAAALEAVGVPRGSELLIVGHSFGADTALDLAADPSFTERYDVSHVVATGHFSQPGLQSVPATTRLLVVQNRHDVVVHLASAMPTIETGVLPCRPAGSDGSPDASVVRFDGGFDRVGHSVEVYRSVFTGRADLDPDDAAMVADFLESIDRGEGPPGTMLAVDISLPRRPPPGIRPR